MNDLFIYIIIVDLKTISYEKYCYIYFFDCIIMLLSIFNKKYINKYINILNMVIIIKIKDLLYYKKYSITFHLFFLFLFKFNNNINKYVSIYIL